MAEERRDFARIPLRLNLTYKIADTEKLGKSLTADFGGGGVRFVAEHPLQPGMYLEVALRLPGRSEPVRFVGKVVWSVSFPQSDKALVGRTSEVGVQFVQIDPKDRALILQETTLYGPPQAPS